jgi:hypothetical protein
LHRPFATHIPPSATQTSSSEQQPPPLQVRPAQQGVPGVPQVVQKPGSDIVAVNVVQTVPGPQRAAASVPGQQISPGWPQGVQVVARQANPAAHELPQQGWLAAPQAGQRPAAHRPPAFAQARPSAMHLALLQQAPPEHRLPEQQGPPA